MSAYIEAGYDNRSQYLEALSEEYDVNSDNVFALASLLRENEDFDGLISALEDMQ